MSHVLTMATTTTPPVTVVSSGLSSMSSVTVAPSLTGFPVSVDQHGMVPPPPLMQEALEVSLAQFLCHSSKLHLQCLL